MRQRDGLRRWWAGLAVAWLPAVSPVHAVPPKSAPVPYADAPVEYRPDVHALRVAAAGLADGHGRLVGQGVRARSVAEQRALGRLEQHIDAILEKAGVSVEVVGRVHDALRSAAHVIATRPLSDGSVVVLMELPVALLTSAWPGGRDAWIH